MCEGYAIKSVSHSIPTPKAVTQFVSEHWDTGPLLSCSLLRSYANDVFRIESERGSLVLKIYRRDWRNTTDAQWEAELCQHLTQHHVRVALPLIGHDDRAVQHFPLPEGDRAALLLPWLPGDKPKAPAEPELYVAFGRAAARLHLATQDFRPSVPERKLDGDYLIRQPLARLQASSLKQSDECARLQHIASEAADQIDFTMQALPSGVCHGDLTLDNVHLLPDGQMAFSDFDLAGRGPFAFDFGAYHGWVQQDNAAAPKWAAFQSGYGEIRPILPEELEAAAWFNLAYQVWDLEHTINNWVKWSGTWRATPSIIQTMLTSIGNSANAIAR